MPGHFEALRKPVGTCVASCVALTESGAMIGSAVS